jgi:hypothetical protein
LLYILTLLFGNLLLDLIQRGFFFGVRGVLLFERWHADRSNNYKLLPNH